MVNEVLQMVNERHEEIMEHEHFPVGLVQRSNDIGRHIFDCLSMSDKSVQSFGLVGMGGIGKTTLAMSIYNKMHSKFEGSSFCVNIRAELKEKDTSLAMLQKKILTELSNQYHDEKINNQLHGRRVLCSRLKDIRALVVLDDVDKAEHLVALYEPLQLSLAPRSVVIITTRDQKLLQSVQSIKIFMIKELDGKMSTWLFNWHAFMKPQPPDELKEVSYKVVEACKGLPLSLKVVASDLYHKTDKVRWEESLNYLLENTEIFDVLKISYNGLTENQKEAFLDICCFLINEREDLVCMVLEAIYKTGRTYLDVLKERCLITTTADNDKEVGRIEMHDQLRDMGRHIVRQQTRRDRAWDEETANDILQVIYVLYLKMCVQYVQTRLFLVNRNLDGTVWKRMRRSVQNCVVSRYGVTFLFQ
ncbi:hypothetical protein KP509_1Z225600 [Ceratopteris richardii]|nr:hypothetical protein KP509_1Z225600 [Ceratopteris richardii]